MYANALIVHVARHYLGSAFNLVVGSASESIWLFTPFPAIKMKGDDLIAGIFRNINIYWLYVVCRFNSCQSLRNLYFCCISHLLADNLQRLRCDAENQPASIGIEKRTRRVHTVL